MTNKCSFSSLALPPRRLLLLLVLLLMVLLCSGQSQAQEPAQEEEDEDGSDLISPTTIITASNGDTDQDQEGQDQGVSSSSMEQILPAVLTSSSPVDIVAVLPDRSTAYPNGLHNGLLLTARRLNLTLEVIDVGNFDPDTSYQVLNALIDAPKKVQPKIYCIWPIDFPSRELLQRLYEAHEVPIIQLNQLPDAETGKWEWDHLLGYAGPDDALRASNAGKMMGQALEAKQQTNVVALGYPTTYGGYHLSINAFEGVLETEYPNLKLVETLGLDWGTQPAYNAVLQLLDQYGHDLHGLYAMDDSILLGAYQAIQDHPLDLDITLVGTVCNGARELLETGRQYGTTVQGPHLEGDLAIRAAHEYLTTGTLQEPIIRFTPNPIITKDTWADMFLDFQGESYTADELCTWSLFYERVAGVTEESVEWIDDVCSIVDCSYIPRPMFYIGYLLCSVNYALALVSGVLLYVHQKKQVIQLAQPFFLGLVVIGSMVDNTSIIFMSRDNQNSSTSQYSLDMGCVLFPWLLSMGHMMTTATLVAKIYRVKKLLGACGSNQGLRKVKVTIAEVSTFIVLFLSIDAILLAAWTATDPLHWEIKISNLDQQGYVSTARGQCDTDESYSFLYPLAIALFHLGTLIYANVLAYQTSDYHKISDSKSVAIALFNSIQLLVIATPLLVVVDDNVAISYFIRICFVFLNNFGVLMLVVVPKLFQCVKGQGHVVPDLHEIARASTIQGGGGANSGGRRRSTIRVSGFDEFDQSSKFGMNANSMGTSSGASVPTDSYHETPIQRQEERPSRTAKKDDVLWTTSGFELFSEFEETGDATHKPGLDTVMESSTRSHLSGTDRETQSRLSKDAGKPVSTTAEDDSSTTAAGNDEETEALEAFSRKLAQQESFEDEDDDKKVDGDHEQTANDQSTSTATTHLKPPPDATMEELEHGFFHVAH